MGKKKKQKFYAIKKGNGVENKIVMTWDECAKLVLGYNSVYKSFLTEDQAKEYLEIDLGTDIKREKNDNDVIKEVAVTIKAPKKSKKVMNGENTIFHIEISTKLFKEFRNKCDNIGQSYEYVVKNMIEEWIEE